MIHCRIHSGFTEAILLGQVLPQIALDQLPLLTKCLQIIDTIVKINIITFHCDWGIVTTFSRSNKFQLAWSSTNSKTLQYWWNVPQVFTSICQVHVINCYNSHKDCYVSKRKEMKKSSIILYLILTFSWCALFLVVIDVETMMRPEKLFSRKVYCRIFS